MDPQSVKYWEGLAHVYRINEDWPEALKALDFVLALKPSDELAQARRRDIAALVERKQLPKEIKDARFPQFEIETSGREEPPAVHDEELLEEEAAEIPATDGGAAAEEPAHAAEPGRQPGGAAGPHPYDQGLRPALPFDVEKRRPLAL